MVAVPSAFHLEMKTRSPSETVSPCVLSTSSKLRRMGSLNLNMEQVARATRNFSPELRIDKGGFGTVYRAVLDSGQVVAIKRAKKVSGEVLFMDWQSNVERVFFFVILVWFMLCRLHKSIWVCVGTF